MTTVERRCPKCRVDLPETDEYWYFRPNGSTRTPCKACSREKDKKYYRRKKKNKSFKRHPTNNAVFTTAAQRRVNPWGCLAIDVVAAALVDHKDGEEMYGFWDSAWFETLCDVADMDSEYLRRGIMKHV